MNLNSKQKFLELSKRYSTLIIIIFLTVLFTALNPRFLSAVNITNIVRQAAIMIIVACGATFIMIAGDVDISCGGVACLASIIAAICMTKGMGILVSITVAVLTGTLFGLLSGIVTNEFGHYFEQKTFKDYYDRLLKDADIGHFTFHALRHTFATRALERGMDYKTLSAILGHYSVAFTMDTYVHSMDEHKRHEMDKMDDMFGMPYSISVENQPYPVLCTLSADGCTAHVPDFPKVTAQAPTLDAALLEVKQQIQKALRQYKNPPIPTKQEQIVVPNNSVLVLVKAG